MRIFLPSELKSTPVTSTTLNELYIASPPLVGREDDLESLSGRLKHADRRLITITGPGGIGKSRLALEAAVKLRDRFKDGVYFVSLVAVTSPEHILSATADEFRFSPQSRIDLKSRFLSYLSGKDVLIVLDNFEHLLVNSVGSLGITDGASVLKELFVAAPSVRVSVTSRQRTGLQAEWVIELQGLPFPKVNADPNPESYGACRLFMKSADKLSPGRSFSDQEKEQVSRICRLAGGMPLGINLAASWVRTLSCKEIADEIEKNLDFLIAPGDADIPLRHRSLRHVFEQSWRNLSENEQLVLRQMSVFRAGCQKDAAQCVAHAPLPVLSDLIDKSILCRKTSGVNQQQSRYDLHELLRQYAEEKLSHNAEDHYNAHQAHCEYYVKFVRDRAASLVSGNQVQAVAEIEEEIANIQAAWEWAVLQEKYDLLSPLVGVLTHFFDIRGFYRTALGAFDRLIDRLGSQGFIAASSDAEKDTLRIALLGKLLLRQGFLYSRLSKYKKAKALLDRSLAIFRSLNGFDDELAFALNYLGHVECFIGEYDSSASHCQEALEIRQRLGDMVRFADTLINIGFGAYMTGNFAEAKTISEKIVQISEEKDDRRGLAIGRGSLAYVDLELGNYDEAELEFSRSLEVCNELGLHWFTPWFMTHAGMVERAKGEYKKAEETCTNALELAREIGDQFRQIHAITNLASIKLSLGAFSEAYDEAGKAVKMSREVEHFFGLARSLNVQAEAAFARENLTAARKFAEESIEISRKRNQQACLAAALCTLGKVAWEEKSYQKSCEHLQEAFHIALKTDAIPGALEILLTSVKLRLLSGRAGDGIAFLRAILRHPKTGYGVKIQAEELLKAHTGAEALVLDGHQETSDLQSADAIFQDASFELAGKTLFPASIR